MRKKWTTSDTMWASSVKESLGGQRFQHPWGTMKYTVATMLEKVMARSERFELPALGIEIRCSIQLSYERLSRRNRCSGFEPTRHRHADQFAFSRLLFKPVRPTKRPFWPI